MRPPSPYAAGAGAFLLLVLGGRLRIRSWVRAGTPASDERLRQALGRARTLAGLGRATGLIESPRAPTPFTVGAFRPVVVLPRRLAGRLSDAELDAVLVHELAHVKRHDPLLLALASLVRAALFFHPLVWLAARQVANMAEAACDDAVLDAGGEPVSYAKMLTRLAEELPRRAEGMGVSPRVILRTTRRF